MNRPECESCALAQCSSRQKAPVLLCGVCSRVSMPKQFCVVEKQADQYLWTLLRTDNAQLALRELRKVAAEDRSAEFAVMQWVPERGYAAAPA